MHAPGKSLEVDIQAPEPGLTPDDLLHRARAMRATLRTRQDACEQAGRILDETNNEFINAGFYRILQPRRFGGYEFDLPLFIQVMMEVSRGCSESGWVLALTAGHAVIIASLPEIAEAALLKMGADYMEHGRRSIEDGIAISDEDERRLLLIEQQCVRLAWDAVELMFRTAGTSSATKAAPLGRYFRNLAVVRTHLTLQSDHTAGNAARLHFGFPRLSRL